MLARHLICILILFLPQSADTQAPCEIRESQAVYHLTLIFKMLYVQVRPFFSQEGQ